MPDVEQVVKSDTGKDSYSPYKFTAMPVRGAEVSFDQSTHDRQATGDQKCEGEFRSQSSPPLSYADQGEDEEGIPDNVF